MHDAAGGLPGHEGQAVVTRVAAQEPQPGRRPVGGPAHHLRRQPHRVTQLEAQHVAVEVQCLDVVTSGQHHVTQALLAGDELVAVRADDPAVFQRGAVKDLQASCPTGRRTVIISSTRRSASSAAVASL